MLLFLTTQSYTSEFSKRSNKAYSRIILDFTPTEVNMVLVDSFGSFSSCNHLTVFCTLTDAVVTSHVFIYSPGPWCGQREPGAVAVTGIWGNVLWSPYCTCYGGGFTGDGWSHKYYDYVKSVEENASRKSIYAT